MGEILLGTSSWSARGWVGPFYPDGTQPNEFLRFYATRFRTVEADVTYYRVPTAAMVRRWATTTPHDFVLSAKFPRSVVHRGDGPRPDADSILRPELVGDDAQAFLDAMATLGPKCGPLVLQFPYFNKRLFEGPTPFLDRLAAFLDWLPDGFRYAVEVRNRTWIAPPLLQLLRAHGVALVLVDLRYMPHPEEIARWQDLVTADFVYARLIGDREATEQRTKSFDRLVLDRTDRLRAWASLIRAYAARVSFVAAYANNHYAGHAPATVGQLEAMLAEGDG